MFIRSERLFLRPIWPEDHGDLGRMVAGSRNTDNPATLSWSRGPQGLPEPVSDSGRSRGCLPHFAVTVPGTVDGRLIGCAALIANRTAVELRFWIERGARSTSYASEVCRELVRLVRALGLGGVVARTASDNRAGVQALEANGFRRIRAEIVGAGARAANRAESPLEYHLDMHGGVVGAPASSRQPALSAA